MKLTFRRRILLAMTPIFFLLLLLGTTGAVLIYYLGNQSDKILRENYDSVTYMRNLNEALERIDSSFQFALTGKADEAQKQYAANWSVLSENVKLEQDNITLPGENDQVDRLAALAQEYENAGAAFYAAPAEERRNLYFGKANQPGLYDKFRDIKRVSGEIQQHNNLNMEQESENSRNLARRSLFWYAVGLIAGLALAVLLAEFTVRTIVFPLRAVTESAAAIGAGNLDQVVSVTSNDELGRLAMTFNTMARQLREYRQSNQERLSRVQRISQATIDSFPFPVLVVDAEQYVEMANPAAHRIFGLAPRDDGALPVRWEPPAALREPLQSTLLSESRYVPEEFDKAILLRENEQERFYLPRLLPIRDRSGATLGAAVLLEDVTRFRLLDEMKNNMVATVSHELKTPLTSLRLVLHLLLEERAGPLAPKQLELLIDARDNAERLLAMINNLLDLARLEQGRTQLALKPELPTTLLRTAYETLLPRASDKGLELVLNDPGNLEAVSADVDQFQHALENLLNNALAHTPAGGRITLAGAAVDGEAVFSVSDTGSGIPAEHLPFIFNRYFRVPGDATTGGSGLGLAIVQEIVVAHGGRVWCESTPGEKTVFYISLPFASTTRAGTSLTGRRYGNSWEERTHG